MQAGTIFNVPKLFVSHLLLTGVGDLVMDCSRLCGIQVKLLLMQII